MTEEVLVEGSGSGSGGRVNTSNWSPADRRSWNRLSPAQRRAQLRAGRQMEAEAAEDAATAREIRGAGGRGSRGTRRAKPRRAAR
jgi:hypothetical protein